MTELILGFSFSPPQIFPLHSPPEPIGFFFFFHFSNRVDFYCFVEKSDPSESGGCQENTIKGTYMSIPLGSYNTQGFTSVWKRLVEYR